MKAADERLRGLQVLADDGDWPHDPLRIAEAACRAGAQGVQLRAKRAIDRQALAWAAQIRAWTREAGLLFVVNDRFDLALACQADGVHLGQEDLPARRVAAVARSRLRIGLSTHTLDQVRRAREQPVDYLGFGPIFGTGSKDSAYDARGLEQLAEAVALAAPLPVVAIGGIDARNAAQVAATGAGLAVIAAVAAADDPLEATRELLRQIEKGRS